MGHYFLDNGIMLVIVGTKLDFAVSREELRIRVELTRRIRIRPSRKNRIRFRPHNMIDHYLILTKTFWPIWIWIFRPDPTFYKYWSGSDICKITDLTKTTGSSTLEGRNRCEDKLVRIDGKIGGSQLILLPFLHTFTLSYHQWRTIWRRGGGVTGGNNPLIYFLI